MHKEHIRVLRMYSVLRAEIESSPTERTQRSPIPILREAGIEREGRGAISSMQMARGFWARGFGDFQPPPSSSISIVGPRHSVLHTRDLSKSQMNWNLFPSRNISQQLATTPGAPYFAYCVLRALSCYQPTHQPLVHWYAGKYAVMGFAWRKIILRSKQSRRDGWEAHCWIHNKSSFGPNFVYNPPLIRRE